MSIESSELFSCIAEDCSCDISFLRSAISFRASSAAGDTAVDEMPSLAAAYSISNVSREVCLDNSSSCSCFIVSVFWLTRLLSVESSKELPTTIPMARPKSIVIAAIPDHIIVFDILFNCLPF